MRTLHRHSAVCSNGQLHSHSTVSWHRHVRANSVAASLPSGQSTEYAGMGGQAASWLLGKREHLRQCELYGFPESPIYLTIFQSLMFPLCFSRRLDDFIFQTLRSNVKSSVKSWTQKNGKICVFYLSASSAYLLWLIRTRSQKRHLTNQIYSIVQQRYEYQLGNV